MYSFVIFVALIAFSCIELLNATQFATVSDQFRDILRDCWSIVNVLPMYPLQNGPFFSFLNDNTSQITDIAAIKQWIFDLCKERYNEMLSQTKRNDAIITSNNTLDDTLDFLLPNIDKDTLNVLDLDETIINQRYQQRALIPVQNSKQLKQIHKIISSKHNTKDLVCTVRTMETLDDIYAYYVIFRPFLMNLINDNYPSSNFIVYSNAVPSVIIPNLILIEMYYNYIYQFHSKTSTKDTRSIFKFDYVIGRLWDDHQQIIRQKSLSRMMRLIGNVTHLKRIIIVDDNTNVWSQEIPQSIINNSCAVFPIQSKEFNVIDYSIDGGFYSINKQRLLDTNLNLVRLFMNEAKRISIKHINNTLGWIGHDQLHSFLISKDIIYDYD